MIGENFEGKKLVLEILAKDPSGVAAEEIAILKARISYLTKEEKERYKIGEFAQKPKLEPKTKTKKK